MGKRARADAAAAAATAAADTAVAEDTAAVAANLPNHFPRLGNLIPPRPLSPTRGGIRNLTLPVHFPRLEGGILSGNLEQVAIWAYLTLTLTESPGWQNPNDNPICQSGP